MSEPDMCELFVYKIKAEGVGYALVNYFSTQDIKLIEHRPLKASALEAKKAIEKLEEIIKSDFSHIEA